MNASSFTHNKQTLLYYVVINGMNQIQHINLDSCTKPSQKLQQYSQNSVRFD